MQYLKGVYAGVVAGLGSLATVLVGADGAASVGLGDVSAGQWVTIALAALIAGGGVYNLPYRPASGSGG